MGLIRTIIRLYQSENAVEKSCGVILKILYEYITVLIPIAIIIHIFSVFHPLLKIEIALFSSVSVSLSISLTVTGIVWCFTFAGMSTEEEISDSSDESTEPDEMTDEALEE